MSSDSGFTFLPAEKRALEALAELDRANRRDGADLRLQAYRITESLPRLRTWLVESDRLVEELPGSKRLRPRRRRGILRHLEGSLRGMPFFDPPRCSTKFSPEPRLRFLKDELEKVMVGGYFEDGIWRPSKDEITFDELRALVDMKAGTLYRLTCKERVPGLIRRNLGNSASHTRDLRFLTTDVMRWSVVVCALLRR